MGATTVDSLQIEVTAKSTAADSAIDKLVERLSILEKQLNSISLTATKTSKGVDKATEKTNNTTRKLDGTTTAVVKTSKTIEKATPGLSKYGLALSGLTAIAGGAIVAFKGFNELVQKLSASTEQYASVMQSINFSNLMAESMPSSIAQLSGLNFDIDTGLLESTGMVSFGVSIKDISQYNATLSTFAKTLGLSEVASANLSDAFVQLAGDISALTGEDYATIGRKLQDALTGSTDALKDFGIVLSDNILQQTAYKYGITETISSMTSAEKAQIAFLTVMEKTQGMFGSQASSVNSLASMYAQWKANLSDITILLGQSFAPIVAGILPYLNAFAILIKDILSSFARLMGFDGIEQPIANISTSVSGVEDAFKGATAAAKKLKTITLGIDELNINSPQESAGGGVGVGVGGASFDLSSQIAEMTTLYNTAVGDAFANAESKVQNILDKIREIQGLMGQGFGTTFVADVDGAVNGFNRIEEVWDRIATNEGFSNSVNNLKENISIMFGSIAGAQSSITWSGLDGALNGVADALEDNEPFITEKLTSISDNLSGFSTNITDFSGALAEIGTALESEGFQSIFTTITDFVSTVGLERLDKITGFFSDLTKIFTSPIIENADEIKQALEKLFNITSKVIEPFKLFADLVSKDSKPYEETWMHGVMTFMEKMSTQSFSQWIDGLNIVLSGIEFAVGTTELGIEDVIVQIERLLSNILGGFANLKNKAREFFAEIKIKFTNFWQKDIMPWFTKEKWLNLFDSIRTALSAKWTQIVLWWNTLGIVKWFNEYVQPYFTKDKWNFTGIKDGLSTAFSGAIEAIKQIWNNFATWLNGKLNFSWDDVNIGGIKIVSGGSINLGKIPTFQTGGFPEDGLFMANHGELVGKFSNGRTAVANNEQIVAGIEYGVERAVERALAPYLSDIARNTRETANKDLLVNIGDRDIARANARGSRSMGYALIT